MENKKWIDPAPIKDSGARQEFETGAVRDISEGKGRCDLLPFEEIAEILEDDNTSNMIFLKDAFISFENFKITKDPKILRDLILIFWKKAYCGRPLVGITELSKQYEGDCQKYGANNWKKGIPTHCYLNSATRHLIRYVNGETDEPHDRAFIWNLVGLLWTLKNKPKLDDIEN